MASAVSQPNRGARARRADDRAEAKRGPAADERTSDERTADDRTVTSARPGIRTRGTHAAGSFMLMVSRLVRLVTWLVVLIIVAGILLRVLDANMTNSIV